MNDEKEKNTPAPATGPNSSACGCEEAGKLGKSQEMSEDETTENDIQGASNYERAESDQSKGIFARQTEAYNKAMDEINERDDEDAKDNLSDYMDELKEESESIGNPHPYGETENSPDFPAEGKFTPPFNV